MSKLERIILCIDDDPDDQLMVQETIRSIEPGARIISAQNGQEGLDHLNTLSAADQLPCLIIMDINMPLMDGKQAIAHLKGEPLFAAIPVVMFTTSSSMLDKTFFKKYNTPFLTKPLRQQELYTLVQKMLSFASC